MYVLNLFLIFHADLRIGPVVMYDLKVGFRTLEGQIVFSISFPRIVNMHI